MRAGKLDKFVTVQQKAASRTSLGDVRQGGREKNDGWTDVKKVHAALARETVKEQFIAPQVRAELECAFELRRWPADTVDPANQRVWYDGRGFNLHGVVDMGRGRGVLVVCTARAEPPSAV